MNERGEIHVTNSSDGALFMEMDRDGLILLRVRVASVDTLDHAVDLARDVLRSWLESALRNAARKV